jgi:hypothetical protein
LVLDIRRSIPSSIRVLSHEKVWLWSYSRLKLVSLVKTNDRCERSKPKSAGS